MRTRLLGWIPFGFLATADRDWMIVNYSLTFAAVTLRIWLPILQYHVFHEFITPYRIVSWWSWVPNLAVALLIVRKRRKA